jgi:outer membrane lipoprotein-sorting protein
MKKAALLCFLFVLMIALCSCGDAGLSKGKAKDIIVEHFKDYYDLVVPTKAEFTFEVPGGYKNILIAQKLGLINAKQVSAMLGQYGMGHSIEKPSMGDTFSITLSEKGNSVPHVEDVHGNICFLTSENKIDDILECTKGQDNQYTVLFSFTEKYTDSGKEGFLASKELNSPWSDDNSKFRGKATMAYDSFLKKYVLKNLVRSKWEKEQWRPSKWTTIEKDKKRLSFTVRWNRRVESFSYEQP